jgi:branched-chain amino acid transport system ATP-binding protein
MTVFENLVVAAAFGGRRAERQVYPVCMEILARCGLGDKANRLAGALPLLDRKRLELARALATSPKVLLLDEVAGGLTEHVVHALLAVVDRLAVLHGGAILAQGEPQAVIRAPAVAEIYMGIEADA